MAFSLLRSAVWVTGAVFALVVAWGFALFWTAGEFQRLTPHFDGTCREVSGISGPEDITIHPGTGIAYVSADDRRAWKAGNPVPGGLYAYDRNAAQPSLVPLTPDAGADFHPHGISLYRGDTTDLLFVINHRGAGTGRTDPLLNRIEVYEVRRLALVHLRSISDPLLVSPNDIHAVGPERFYVTNDHGSATRGGQLAEDLLWRSRANVVFYDGSRFREVASGLRYANGVHASPDGTLLYVTATAGRELRVYDRDTTSGALTLRTRVPLGSGADNIELDAGGNLWIGSHPKLLSFQWHALDARMPAPSQVLRVAATRKGRWRFDEIYLDTGAELSASSVAAIHGRRMLIGAALDARILDCRLPAALAESASRLD